MSASRFNVAWRMSGSGVADPTSLSVSWCVSRPHTHCTVPAPNTIAPLECLYIVRWCVAVPGRYVLPMSCTCSGTETTVEDI